MWKKALIAIVFLLTLTVQPNESSAKAQEIYVFMDGRQVLFTNNPIVTKGSTMIEFRPVFEALGMTVQWNAKSKKITGTKKGLTIELTLNSSIATVNGKRMQMPVAPNLKSGRTLVPLRFISEASGKNVLWNGNVNMILINDGQTFDEIVRRAPSIEEIYYEAYNGMIGGIYLDLDRRPTMAQIVSQYGFPDVRVDKTKNDLSSYIAYGDHEFGTDIYSYSPVQDYERLADGGQRIFFSEYIIAKDVTDIIGKPIWIDKGYGSNPSSMTYRVGDYFLTFSTDGILYGSRVLSYSISSAISG